MRRIDHLPGRKRWICFRKRQAFAAQNSPFSNRQTPPRTTKGNRMSEDEVEITGKVRDKLIERKQDWARDGRLLTGTTADPDKDRLPPGQRLVKDWPVLDLGAQPNVTEQKFRLDVDGAVENRVSLRLDEFMALPMSDSLSDMHCVTQWSRYDNHWKGVSAQALLAIVKPRAEVKHVIFHAYDGYTANIRLDQFDQPDVFLVHQWEGKPISTEQRCGVGAARGL